MKKFKNKKKLKEKKKKMLRATFSDGRVYFGQTRKTDKSKKIIPEGLGNVQWPDGQYYKGEFKNGVFDGWGTYTAPGSHVFIGLWKKGFMTKGQKKSENGEHYTGAFKKSLFDGYGVMNYSNNSKFECQWKNNFAHGKGKLTILKDHEGVFEHEKGEIWNGRWKNGIMDGIFIIKYPDGEILDATWVKGERTKAKFRHNKKLGH